MDVFYGIDLSALGRTLDQLVPKCCQHPGIPSTLGDIAALDYGLDNGD
jgi:hypothetical protein